LSKTTVSRALDGYADVAEATRARVRAAAAETGYRPNPVARRLSQRATGMVALVMPAAAGQLYEPLFVDLAAAIGSRLADSELDLTLLAPRPGEPELAVWQRIVEGRRADALVVVRTAEEDARVAYLQRTGVPFVCFGRTRAPAPYAFVDGDGEAGFRAAAAHLVGLGHRRFAYLSGPVGAAAAARRGAGLAAALAAAGLAPAVVVEGASNEASGRAMAGEVLAGGARPTMLVCATDRIAVGALSAVRAAGLAVGRDVSVMGHDNLPVTAFTDPPLATMELRLDEAGTCLAETVLALLDGAQPEAHATVLPVRPVWRASVGAPA